MSGDSALTCPRKPGDVIQEGLVAGRVTAQAVREPMPAQIEGKQRKSRVSKDAPNRCVTACVFAKTMYQGNGSSAFLSGPQARGNGNCMPCGFFQVHSDVCVEDIRPRRLRYLSRCPSERRARASRRDVRSQRQRFGPRGCRPDNVPP